MSLSAQDRAALNASFKDMRKIGLIARQGFSRCRGCAGFELGEEVLDYHKTGRPLPAGAVFYTRSERTGLSKTGAVYIVFGQVQAYDGERLVATTTLATADVGKIAHEIFLAHGVPAIWDGDPDNCIELDFFGRVQPEFG